MDLKIDDLLEKKNQGVDSLDMEYVSLSVNKVLALLNKYVARVVPRRSSGSVTDALCTACRTFQRKK